MTADRRINATAVEIINELVKKINGTLHVASDKDTSYYIDFKS